MGFQSPRLQSRQCGFKIRGIAIIKGQQCVGSSLDLVKHGLEERRLDPVSFLLGPEWAERVSNAMKSQNEHSGFHRATKCYASEVLAAGDGSRLISSAIRAGSVSTSQAIREMEASNQYQMIAIWSK